MRGKVFHCTYRCVSPGITPAYAGKSSKLLSFALLCRDHPRLCGEKCPNSPKSKFVTGSPPPMRGKAFWGINAVICQGITPAYAGKSVQRSKYFNSIRDHPRLCGEKFLTVDKTPLVSGSPPPMRGKEEHSKHRKKGDRITPAYAGKRVILLFPLYHLQDHPRLCGEKASRNDFPNIIKGSPPPMRGKGMWELSLAQVYRITPAYAGKSS